MSYTRRFSKEITVYYSGTTSYPASERGGTTSYSGSTTETIYFDVTVDTDPFDASVGHTRQHVDMLTGAVTATEAAHVASIRESSRRIGQTIVDGFFKTVRSDISQKIAQLKIQTDSLLLQLHELAKRCNDKRRAMTVDYERTCARYAKIFGDLNNELENRIKSIDQPIFKFTDKADEIDGQLNDNITVPTVHAAENIQLHSKITAAHAKKEAVRTIERAKRFLDIQYSTDRLLASCLRKGGSQEMFVAPYCILEATDGKGNTVRDIYRAPMLRDIDENILSNAMPRGNFAASVNTQDCFNAQVAAIIAEDPSEHGRRVARMTASLFNSDAGR